MKFNQFLVKRHFLLLLILAVSGTSLWAQSPVSSRSGIAHLRTSGVAENLPCAGSQIFFEDFESGLPAGWTIIDGDTLTPEPQTGLAKGWQLRADYDDTTNTVMVSPSWYQTTGVSDDWLITPQIALGSNSCFSWTARSQDPFFEEAYEIRISTTNPDTASLQVDSALVIVTQEDGNNTIRSVNLSAYAGQNVYLAFHHTSDDKFVLVLDDVKVSNVNNFDVGVVDIDYGSPQPGDTVRFTMEVANFGSDTVTGFEIVFSVDGSAAQITVIDSVVLVPNATITAAHEVFFISDSTDAFYNLCGWTRQPNSVTDEDVSNDTTCLSMVVGSPVGRPEPEELIGALEIFPNPFADRVQLRLGEVKGYLAADIRLLDPVGRIVYSQAQILRSNQQFSLDPGHLAAGLYILQIQHGDQVLISRRLVRF
ncbi:MAG: choice-of-anchor J domain-containing protein [Bacteroidota bacterium]